MAPFAVADLYGTFIFIWHSYTYEEVCAHRSATVDKDSVGVLSPESRGQTQQRSLPLSLWQIYNDDDDHQNTTRERAQKPF